MDFEKSQRSIAANLVAALDREICSRGHGTIREMERSLGEKTGWWHYRRETGDLKMRDLLRVLDYLGLHRVGFLREHLTQGDGLELDRPRGRRPPLVEKAWARLDQSQPGPGVGAKFLDSLDERRYEDPARALQLAEGAVELVELELLPRLLGIAGSAWRVHLCLDEAEHAFHAGIEIARSRGDRVTAGNLLRRMSYVLADRGQHQGALAIAERAAVVLHRESDTLGSAKSLVEQGIWLFYLDRCEEAIRAFQTGLQTLPEESSRYRVAAFQCMGLANKNLGNQREALKCLRAASQSAAQLGPWDQAKLRWLQAGIHFELGELEDAARLLFVAVEALRGIHYGDAALATCDLVRVLLLQGHPSEAFKIATSMRALVEPLRKNAVISGAIAELLRFGEAGLTLSLLDRVRSQVESAQRQRLSWVGLKASR